MQKFFTKAQEEDVREAVFRYHMAKLPAQFRSITRIKFPEVYFLSVNNADPSPTLLVRFRSHTPAVKPLSKVKPRSFEVLDQETGKQGVELNTYQIRRITENQAKVETGWRKSGRSGTSGVCLVERQKGGWVVIYYSITEVS